MYVKMLVIRLFEGEFIYHKREKNKKNKKKTMKMAELAKDEKHSSFRAIYSDIIWTRTVGSKTIHDDSPALHDEKFLRINESGRTRQ